MSDEYAFTLAGSLYRLKQEIESLRTPREGMGVVANCDRYLAAVTIEDLVGEVEALKRAIRNNDRDIADLIQQRLELISNADKLRAERDEARREVCKLKAWNAQERLGPEGYALLRKWDCFARDTSEHL